MVQEERISTSRPVAAPPSRIFELVCRPGGHVEIDGSGMLLASSADQPVTAVGDTFAMHMDRRPLGDIPDLAEYDVTVVITGIEPDVLLEWSVMMPDGKPYGHIYGYRLEPLGSGETLVTTYCDWSGLAEDRKNPDRWPVVPLRMLEASLDNLEAIVTK